MAEDPRARAERPGHRAVSAVARRRVARHLDENKRPLLSDLRECVTGDTLVTLADGRRRPIAGSSAHTGRRRHRRRRPRRVCAHRPGLARRPRRAAHRLASGRRASVRRRSTAFAHGTDGGTLGELTTGDRVAVARRSPSRCTAERWPDDRVILLGHLIGDGSDLTHQPLRYTTASEENSAAVARAAEREFGATVRRHEGRGNWHQLVISGNGNRWHPAGVGRWLRELGIWNERSAEKRVPDAAFRLAERSDRRPAEPPMGDRRHDLGRDGVRASARRPAWAFTTVSEGLAADVAALLLRVGIVARINTARSAHRDDAVQRRGLGSSGPARFLARRGGGLQRREQAAALEAALADVQDEHERRHPSTIESGSRCVRACGSAASPQREMSGDARHEATEEPRISGSLLRARCWRRYADDPRRRRARRAVRQATCPGIGSLPSTTPGQEDVYDLTVPGPSCWLADGIVSHNSGADRAGCRPRRVHLPRGVLRQGDRAGGIADIIIAKDCNGAIGEVDDVRRGVSEVPQLHLAGPLRVRGPALPPTESARAPLRPGPPLANAATTISGAPGAARAPSALRVR